MTLQKVKLIHPEGKKAPSMDKMKYNALRTSFLHCLKVKKVAPFQELLFDVEIDLKNRKLTIEGKLEWNLFWVTLDLEARKELNKDRSTSPITYSLSQIIK